MQVACFSQSSQAIRAGAPSRARRAVNIVTRAVEPKQDASPSTSNSTLPTPAKPTIVREVTEYGARIVESDAAISGPEDQKDFWEGDNMETFGKVMERFFLPGLVVLGLICGGIAARTYNDDADVFIAPPPGPDADLVVVPAGALTAPRVVVEAGAAAPAVAAE